MSDISKWLKVNAQGLARITQSSGLDTRLVHMMAIFVLADLDDDQITAQLLGRGFSVDPDRRGRDRLVRALSQIRTLTAKKDSLVHCGWSAGRA